jgi:hypothetical protein
MSLKCDAKKEKEKKQKKKERSYVEHNRERFHFSLEPL